MTRRQGRCKSGTQRPRVRTDLEVDSWKALSKYKEETNKKPQRSEMPGEVEHEKLTIGDPN